MAHGVDQYVMVAVVGLDSKMSFKQLNCSGLCLRQGEFQEQRAIYIKSVVAGGAADMVCCHSQIYFSLSFFVLFLSY